MTKARTQVERVIAAAHSFRGITQVDFLAPDVVDGGPPITRLAARLYEAEREGHSFECLGRRDKCKIWRLIGVEGTSGVADAACQTAQAVGAATGHSSDEGEGSRKAPVRQGDAGLISRASAAGSLNAEPDDLRLFEPPVPSALKEAA